ncbi:hypothetical protein [Azospirillum sp. B4]|uniref:hypothetical protein n=1 Tax=Azospirillum sp. B4 TaxID=95605 RepID=UPI0011DE2D07|nr:hypothetical protein [Azospirillum sp. B4]
MARWIAYSISVIIFLQTFCVMGLAADGPPPLIVHQNKSEVLKNAEELVGFSFSVVLINTSWNGRKLSWKLVPGGEVPGEVNDFPVGATLSGYFEIPSDSKAGREIFIQELTTPINVIHQNGKDTFEVQFFADGCTIPLRDAQGTIISAAFAVYDHNTIAAPIPTPSKQADDPK